MGSDCKAAHVPGKSNVLVIGGSGHVSGSLARTLVENGHNVWIVTRGQKPVPDGVTALVADRKDRAAFAELITAQNMEWDAVMDCIAYEEDDAKQDVEVFSDKAGQIVFVSTDFTFDPTKRRFPQPTDSPYTDVPGYGRTKRECELILHASDMRWTIVRPCHIYGPPSQLGCLPMHGRDPELIAKMRAGTPLQLVGGGHFLQQPIFVKDLAELMHSAIGNEAAYGGTFCTAGPDIIESKYYYEVIADILGVELRIEEIPVRQALAEHPEMLPFFCHRIYDLSEITAAGLKTPSTPIEEGLRIHTQSLMG